MHYLYHEVTPVVEKMSIDEAYLDLTAQVEVRGLVGPGPAA